MKAQFSVTVLFAGCLAATGCVPYKSNYGCRGYPDHTSCVSMETIYDETHERDALWTADMGHSETIHTDEGKAKNRNGAAPKSYTGRRAEQVPGDQPYHQPDVSYQDYPAAPDPTITPDYTLPIRTPATVMRVWIAPWIDANDTLMMSGYVYTEIEKRRWMIGEPTVDERQGAFMQEPLVEPTMPTNTPAPSGQRPR